MDKGGNPLQNPFKTVISWVADALIEKITEPIDLINKRLDRLESLHQQDAAALEADLSVMDDRICYLIGVCRKRGYTTAEERRRVTRMHDAYKARGGNHGEENEYAAFIKLPAEEDFMRANHGA